MRWSAMHVGAREERRPQPEESLALRAQDLSYLGFHRRHNTYHTPPLSLGGGNKTQGAETIVAGGLIMASSLVCWI